ncbi:MAG TPA: carboxypeptidase regulatory-like domain-containing protein [Candidatus Sulfotelmatobacter sp.]|jgi:predicted porin|nr:carboxypeptidase regulatory-like domain-containing protein [Candidatus Sulfotelmatobacter sp.]
MKRSDRSQNFFRHGRQWKTLTRVGYIPTAASLLLAQSFLLFLWLAMAAFPASAQTTASLSAVVTDENGASLSGVVTDQTGGALANVAVTIKNVNKTETRTISTDRAGHYQTSGLPAGRFEIRAAKKGFADETRANISLAADQGATVDIKMQQKGPDPCTSGKEFATTDCALTWHGVTLYGAYDIGVGWVSHGLPVNGYNYEGESLVNRNGAGSRFLVAPNNLQQTGFGIRGKEEFFHGWYIVFNASTGINPNSGLLADASKTNIVNNGLPRSSYSEAIDGARAGQPFNDEYYGGVSSDHFGTITFGRQRSLGTDAMLQYDPVGGGYGFSYIGYNGTMAGGGDTEDSRWDDALKYRLTYGPVHFGAMYKFVNGSGGCFSASATWTALTCTPEQPHNNAFGFDLGGEHGNFSADAVYQHYNQAISVLNPLLGPQSLSAPFQSTTDSINTNPITGGNLIDPNGTVYGIVTDNNALMFAAKYKWDPLKFFVGYEYIWQNNPKNPLGVGASQMAGYILSGVEDNNLDTQKLVNIWWAGVKYSYDSKTDVTAAWYQQRQNDFRLPPECSASAGFRASCAGTLNETSIYLDHHFTPRFDGYAGIAYSYVDGGLAIAIPHGPGVPYNHHSNLAPTIGVRFAF